MHYVSLIVEFLRGRPAVVFWLAALTQAALWVVIPSLFYSAPPGELPDVLAIGHEFRMGSSMGPPLAFWLAELAFALAGVFGVYVLAQACIVAAYWAVFTLGRAIVGTRHAVLAVLLMAGIAAFSVPSPDFGPGVLAIPLWALALLYYWRAVGEGERGYWFLLAFDLTLLLLANYLGLILLVVLALFSFAMPRARTAFVHSEAWVAVVLLLLMLVPQLAWLIATGNLAAVVLGDGAVRGELWPVAGFAAGIVLVHLGVVLLVALASGWRVSRHQRAPEIDRHAIDGFGRQFIYYFAAMPVAVALVAVFARGSAGPFERIGPLVVLSGLAIIAAAGDQVRLYRERQVSFAWLGLLTVPPLLVVLALVLLPWTIAADFKVAQPAGTMGRFFADNFQRRTGQPLSFVGGDQRLASLIAVGAPSRPSVFFDRASERSPWASVAEIREKGAILVWPSTDTAGTPPAELKAQFPELVPEVPRVFARPVQGLLPLIRVGWAVIRPAGSPLPAAPVRRIIVPRPR